MIHLSEEDKKLAREEGLRRRSEDREMGIKDKKVGPQSGEITDVEGAAAEIAFARYFGVEPLFGREKFLPYDVIIPDGTKVDVKWTSYQTGHMIVPVTKKEDPADMYALVIGRMDEGYRIAGWLRAKDVFLTPIRDGELPAHWVKQSQLEEVPDGS